MENFVFVIDTTKKPLNPVHPARARELLTQGKAAVFRTYPFVIILHHAVEAEITPELALSLLHRVQTTETWVNRILKYVPVKCIYVEQVKFDMQKMQNPEISGVEYQQGELSGYRVREYLLEKWNRQCTYCGKKDVPLQVEHITPKAKGGSDRVSNLCLSCEKCNQKKGIRDIKEFLKSKPEVLKRVLSEAKASLKDAAAVNATRNRIGQMLKTKVIPVIRGEGCQTKMNRINSVLPKAHFMDAACVSDCLIKVNSRIFHPLVAICKGQGGRQKAALNKFGYPIRHNPLKPIKGWMSGDIAKRIDTREFGRVNPRSASNCFNFTPFGGKAVSVHVNKLIRVHQKDGYTYTLSPS